MDRQGLPGIESLFREQERLANKLSQQELNALRRYLQKAVHAECEVVVARMRYLQAAQDVNESQYQHALSSLQKDLHVQRTVAGEFRREFSSLANVLQAREQRHAAKQETLVRQVLQGREAVQEAVKAKDILEAELQQKQTEVNQQKDMVVELEDQLAHHQDCHSLRDELSRLNKDLLKAKLDNDNLRKELAEVTSKLGQDTKRIGAPSALAQSKISHSSKHHVRFSPSVLAPRNTPVTFTPVTPYCTSNTCRARVDLEECRLQFIKKCEEVVSLKTALADQKTKCSREKLTTFAVHPASGERPSAAVQPLKPAYPKGREAAGLRKSGSGNTATPCAAGRSFKFGPVAPVTMNKK